MLQYEIWVLYESLAPIDHLGLQAEVSRFTGVPTTGQITDDSSASQR